MTIGSGPFPTIGSGSLDRAGTPRGDQKRAEFIAKLLEILGDTRLLWLPKVGDAATRTDESRNARVFTYASSVAALMDALGSGLTVDFNGSSQEATVPDNADFSFGDGAADRPMSIVGLIKPDTISGTDVLLAKYDLTTGSTKREWRLYLNAGVVSFQAWDESAAAAIGRSYSVALTAGTTYLIVVTSDGSGANTGVNIYLNAARVDDGNTSTGTYVAMEDLAGVVRLGSELGAAAAQSFFDGKFSLAALAAKALSADEVWEVKTLVNAFFALSL